MSAVRPAQLNSQHYNLESTQGVHRGFEWSYLLTMLISALLLSAPAGIFVDVRIGTLISDAAIATLTLFFIGTFFVYGTNRTFQSGAGLLAICILTLFIIGALGAALTGSQNFTDLFKRVGVFIIVLGICVHAKMIKSSHMFWSSIAALILIGLFVSSMPAYYHESETFIGVSDRRARLWPFFEQSPHSSGYYVAAVTAILVFARPRRPNLITLLAKFGCVALGIYLVAGFRSSQVYFTVFAFAAGYMIISDRFSLRVKVLGVVFGLTAALYVVIDKVFYGIHLRGFFELERLGSGRFGTWLFRLNEFATRDLPQMLLGNGPGSDFVEGGVWIGKITLSHNSFLTYLFEFGSIGFVIFLMILLLFARNFSSIMMPGLIAIIASAAIGNGLIVRPTPLVFVTVASILSAGAVNSPSIRRKPSSQSSL